jgi:RNA polymerase-binding transcription factor
MLAVMARRRCTMVDLKLWKKRLEDELLRVNKRIADLKLEPEPEELESAGDNTPLSEAADAALVARERELSDKVLGSLLDRAAALDQALGRVADGTYGLCVACHAKIPEARLAVLPEVALCAPCQAKAEEEPSHRNVARASR